MTEETDLYKEIEDFAYKYLRKEDISIITGVPVDELSDPDSEAGKAFLKGRLIRKAEYNFNVMKLTDQLSSPAMAIEHKISLDAYLDDIKTA